MRFFTFLFIFFLSFNSFADFPKNNLKIYPFEKTKGGIYYGQFLTLVEISEKIYKPIFQDEKGLSLSLVDLWENPNVNASTSQTKTKAIVYLYGGMARHKEMTYEGFALIICHEIGHHLAGEPTYYGRWASVEGQSDYWGAKECLSKILGTKDEEKLLKAGMALGRTLAEVTRRPYPSFEIEDETIVDKVFSGHPKPQCRLDTYKRGIKNMERPLCWFKPSF